MCAKVTEMPLQYIRTRRIQLLEQNAVAQPRQLGKPRFELSDVTFLRGWEQVYGRVLTQRDGGVRRH